MTQEKRDILYNKNVGDLTDYDVKFIKKLIVRQSNEVFVKEALIVPPIAFVTLPLIMNAFGLIYFNSTISLLMGIAGILVSGTLAAGMSMVGFTLRSLGLTRKDWKELKKSGRLKELIHIVEEYDKSLKSDLDNLYEREEEITAEINLKEEEKQSLIDELVELYAEKKAIIAEKYTQEKVSQMLAYEANLLVRTAERIQQSKQMIIDMDENSSNEVGKKLINLNRAINELNSVLPENSISD